MGISSEIGQKGALMVVKLLRKMLAGAHNILHRSRKRTSDFGLGWNFDIVYCFLMAYRVMNNAAFSSINIMSHSFLCSFIVLLISSFISCSFIHPTLHLFVHSRSFISAFVHFHNCIFVSSLNTIIFK